MESNALSPINAIKENDISNLHWAAEPIGKEILDNISYFGHYYFIWAPRCMNNLAYLTCQWAASQEIYELIDPNGLPLSFGFD